MKNEPQRLALEAERYNSDLEALVLENYRLFVKNLTYSGQLPNEVRTLDIIYFPSDDFHIHRPSAEFQYHCIQTLVNCPNK